MNLRDILFSTVLPTVNKASRYLGTEFNSVHKVSKSVDLRIALAFPDLYDLALGNLGLHILYAILNELPWCWAERTYAPAPDLETILRARDLPLFAWESKDPLTAMDVIGFTFQSELTYTNVLNMLNLAGIPLRSDDRGENHPLIIAGGPTTANPEPMAPFIDAFVIGDGEEVIVAIAQALRAARGEDRQARLAILSGLDGVYVPSIYPTETSPDGRVMPRADRPPVVRQVVRDLDAAPFPRDYIVPFTQQVHDRVAVEVHRGCTRGCRFCQAGVITRPVRERTIDTIDELITEALAATGYEEVGLVSLSTCDYSRATELVQQAARCGREYDASVSLPSLRMDVTSVQLADYITGVRRSGLTLAPETASPAMQQRINKVIPAECLFETACEAYRRGWDHIKFYFMIGLPGETDEDIQAIIELCRETIRRGREITPKAKVFTGISTFVPKPFTPFQWAEQISFEETQRRQELLRKGLSAVPGVRFGHHEPESTFIEGLLSRGDRRAADIIEKAYCYGARFESDNRLLNLEAWQRALDDTGFEPADAFRARDLDEPLPWDHIDMLVSKNWLRHEWARAENGETTDDCRWDPCNQCGLTETHGPACAVMRERARHRDDETIPDRPTPAEEPPQAQRLRFRIGRYDEARFLSNLEWMTAWVRALRRAGAPLSYSQGFHAHPKVTFSSAPPVGEASDGEYLDAILRTEMDPAELLARLRGTLPPGMAVFEVTEVPLKTPSLMSSVLGFSYSIHTKGEFRQIQADTRRLLDQSQIVVDRATKSKGRGRKKEARKMLDIRPAIRSMVVHEDTDGDVIVDFATMAVEGKLAKPREIIRLLGLDPEQTWVLKRATYLADVDQV